MSEQACSKIAQHACHIYTCRQDFINAGLHANASGSVGGMYPWVPQPWDAEALLIAATSCTAGLNARLMPHIKGAARPCPCKTDTCSHYACEQGDQAQPCKG